MSGLERSIRQRERREWAQSRPFVLAASAGISDHRFDDVGEALRCPEG
jgi:hypothetical protein